MLNSRNATSDHSFLASDEDTKRDFASAGFEITTLRDTTQTPTELAMMRHKLETEGLPAVGSHVLVGDQYLQLWSTRCARPNRGECGRLRLSLNDAPKSICASGGSSENGAPRRRAGERLDASAHRSRCGLEETTFPLPKSLSFEEFSRIRRILHWHPVIYAAERMTALGGVCAFAGDPAGPISRPLATFLLATRNVRSTSIRDVRLLAATAWGGSDPTIGVSPLAIGSVASRQAGHPANHLGRRLN